MTMCYSYSSIHIFQFFFRMEDLFSEQEGHHECAEEECIEAEKKEEERREEN